MSVSCEKCGRKWPRDPSLEVDCPVCDAKVGHPCRSKRPSGYVHSAGFSKLPDWGHDERELVAAAANHYGCGCGLSPDDARARLDAYRRGEWAPEGRRKRKAKSVDSSVIRAEQVSATDKGSNRYRTDKRVKRYLLAKRPADDDRERMINYRTETCLACNTATKAPPDVREFLHGEHEWAVARLRVLAPHVLKSLGYPEQVDRDDAAMAKKTKSETDAVRRAFVALLQGRASLSLDGTQWMIDGKRVAPWSAIVFARFADPNEFQLAAQSWQSPRNARTLATH